MRRHHFTCSTSPLVACAATLAAAWILCSPAAAADEEAALLPTLPPDADLGYSVAVHGNRAVVGAPRGTGVVYVLVRQPSGEWVLETKLVPEDGGPAWSFGHSVDIFGEWIVVGAPGDGGFTGKGAVYTYMYDSTTNTWEPRAKIVPTTVAPTFAYETFGRAVSLTADRLAVSDPRADHTVAERGIVHVYRLTGQTFALDQRLWVNFSPFNAQFGFSIDMTPQRLVVGAPLLGNGEVHTYVFSSTNDEYVFESTLTSTMAQNIGYSVAQYDSLLLTGAPSTNNDRGMVTLWERTGGAWVDRQNISGAADGERFGRHVALYPPSNGLVRALISAPESDLHANNGGRAAIYEGDGSGLTLVAPLFASAPLASERLGTSLALGEDFALAGAWGGESMHAFELDGSSWSHTQRYQGTDHDPNELLGNAVALSGNFAIVGARQDDDASHDAGAAHIFFRASGEWLHIARLVSTVPQRLAHYGSAVAMAQDGGTVIVGAPDEDGAGAVYVHIGDTFVWNQGSRETAPDSTLGSEFGAAVGIEGNVAVVGAPNANGGANQSGAVYVYRPGFFGNWNYQQKLFDPGGQSQDEFGAAVAVTASGEILVGAPGKDVSGPGSGQVFRYAFDGTTWNVVDVLAPSSVTAGEGFGQALSTSSDRLAVGAPLAASGRVYLFEQSAGSWIFQETLTGEFGYGRSVGIDDGLLSVSSIDRAWALHEWAVGWSSEELLPSTGPIEGFQLTTPVAVSAGAILVGADGDPAGGPLSGAAYVFRPDEPLGIAFCFGDGSGSACPCGNTGGPGEGCAHSAGGGMTIRATGSASIAADDLVVIAEQVPPGNAGLIYSGTVALETPNVIWDGLQCTLGATRRYQAQFQTDGVFTDTGFVAQDPSGDYFIPGGTYHFQLWTRDASNGPSPCGSGANYSPAYGVVMTP